MIRRNLLAICIGLVGLITLPAQAEVKISGLLEVEADFTEDYGGAKTSDITLATVELRVDAKVSNSLSIRALALYEDDETEEMEIDEGIITYIYSQSSYVSAGRMYVPFGVFETNMISDPLTLELAETRESALVFGYVGGTYGSIYLFNGDTIELGAGDNIEHFGAKLGIVRNLGGETIDTGIGYITSLGDSDGVSDFLTGGAGGSVPVTEYVSATSIHYNYRSGSFIFLAEYIKADKAFNALEFGFNGAGAEPSAINIEIGQASGNTTWAIALQETEQAVALGLPEERQMLSYTNRFQKDTTFAIEYIKDKDYTGASANTITLQLAAEFK